MRFNFDFLSFLLGVIVTSIIGGIVYRFRNQINALRNASQAQASTTRRFITNTSEGRYMGDFVKTMNATHIAGDVADLKDIYVEPRFIRTPEPVDPNGEHIHSVFHVVPILHDMPQLYAPYNVDSLTVHDLQIGETHLALLGLPGSGKSTALAIMGLMAAGEINIEPIDMMSDQIFEDEIKDLSPEEREKAIRRRQDIQARAFEQLEQMHQKQAEEGKVARTAVQFERMLPIMVHMRDIDLRPEAYSEGGKPGRPLDPAEPIVKALQRRVNVVTASALPRLIYRRLNAGTCLVMIDGYDDLAPSQRQEKLQWLQQFMDIYGANFIVVTGPISGFDPLVNLGLTPIFLRAWQDSDYNRLVERWTEAWPTIAGQGRRKAEPPEEQIVRRVSISNRGRSPFDVTLKIWAAYANDEKLGGRHGWYDFYIRRLLTGDAERPAVEKLAAAMLDEGDMPLARARIKEIVTEAVKGADGKTSTNVDELIGKLVGHTYLITNWPDGTYSFAHPVLTAFLAGESLANATPETFTALAAKPAWDLALAFAAAHAAVDPAVNQRLNSAPDLLYTALFSLAPWLTDAPPTAGWRAEVFKRLTAALLSTSQFPIIRERAVAGMVASRDKNIIFVLRKALESPDATVRLLSCIGLGALGESDAIRDLGKMLADSNSDVQLAAGLALGAIGSETALETMLGGLVEGEQALRQAVAEALAAIPAEGHAVLRDAINSKDMMVRYAAVFGLARIKAAWSLSLLYRTLLEDEQWYVRNAAEQAFREAERPEGSGAIRHPEPDSLPWVVEWAAKKGEGVPVGPTSRQILVRVLQEGEPVSRIAAAHTLASLGYVPALKPLYGALRDRDENVRAAVYESLSELQTRLGEHLPAVG